MSKKDLASKISKKKSELAPVIKELKALREAIDVSWRRYVVELIKYLLFVLFFTFNKYL